MQEQETGIHAPFSDENDPEQSPCLTPYIFMHQAPPCSFGILFLTSPSAFDAFVPQPFSTFSTPHALAARVAFRLGAHVAFRLGARVATRVATRVAFRVAARVLDMMIIRLETVR